MMLPWEVKEAMFHATMKYAEAEDPSNHEDAFLLALYYGLGFGVGKNFEKLVHWCSEAAIRGSPVAKALLIPISKFSATETRSELPITRWLREAVDYHTGTQDRNPLLWAFSVLKQYDVNAYSSARSLYSQKTRAACILRIAGETSDRDPRFWLLSESVREDILDRIKVKYQTPDNVLRIACIEGDKDLAYSAIRLLEANVNFIPENKFGGTPVMLAIRNGHIQLAEQLIKEFNADVRPNLTDEASNNTLVVLVESALEN